MLPLKYRNRFWSKVEPDPSGCWIWQDAPNSHGYGVFGIGDGKLEYAHRLALNFDGEELLDGFVVHHRCGTRLCVRPEHLEQMPRWFHSDLHDALKLKVQP